MKRIKQGSFVGFLVILASVLVACERSAPVPPGRPAPQFELKDAAGNVHSLAELKGTVSILHFWASWCPPCIEEIPRWIAAAPTLSEHPVKLVAISVDETWDKALKVFPQSKLQPNMLLLLDPTGEVARKYGTQQFPESYLINRDLMISEKLIGSQDWTGSKIRFGIARALSR